VVWKSIAENWCSRARNFTSPAGPMGRKGSIGRKEKIAVSAKNWKVIAVLGWINRDWECRVLTQIPGRSP